MTKSISNVLRVVKGYSPGDITMHEGYLARSLAHNLLVRNRFADEQKSESDVEAETDKIMKLLLANRDFTGAQIALIAERYFAHVDA